MLTFLTNQCNDNEYYGDLEIYIFGLVCYYRQLFCHIKTKIMKKNGVSTLMTS